jgi:hypothetical protein
LPYKSQAQSNYIHAKASEGEPWAKKYVADSHGSKVPKKVKRKRRKKVKHGRRHRA